MREKVLEDLLTDTDNVYLRPKDKCDLREHLLIEQDHQCAVCDKDLREHKNTNKHLDHNHSSKMIRGVLCASCNLVLGKIERAGYGADWLIKLNKFLSSPQTNIVYPEKITSRRKTMKNKMRDLLKMNSWSKPVD